MSHKCSNKFMHTKHLEISQGRGDWHLPHHRQQMAQAIALNTHLKDILTFPMMLPTSYKRKKARHKGINTTKCEDNPAQLHNEAKSWCTLSPAEGQGGLKAQKGQKHHATLPISRTPAPAAGEVVRGDVQIGAQPEQRRERELQGNPLTGSPLPCRASAAGW